MENDNYIIKYCIQKMQEEHGWTMTDIANRLNVTIDYLSRMKNGRQKVGLKFRKKIMDLANVTASSITEQTSWAPKTVHEPRADYGNKILIEDILTDARHKRSVIDKMMDDQKSRTEQMDKVIAELQRMNDLIILKLRN
jgi:transcriptional regulator with XRE-family HTH domain